MTISITRVNDFSALMTVKNFLGEGVAGGAYVQLAPIGQNLNDFDIIFNIHINLVNLLILVIPSVRMSKFIILS